MTEPTLDDCKNTALMGGLTDADGEEFFYHYAAQGWVFGNGQPVKNIAFALARWRINKKKRKVEDKKKTKLYPIKGKFCHKRGYGMPAVWRSGGDYPHHACLDHAPAKIREKYI